jgi:uncharacterized protein YjbI with pentapeptide repeats
MLLWSRLKARQAGPIQRNLFPSIRRNRNFSAWIRLTLIVVLVIALAASTIARQAIRASVVQTWTALQTHSGALLPFGLIVIAVSSILLLWLLPRWQTAKLRALTPEARFDKENESRKTLAQIIGGLFVIGSLFSTVKTLQVSQQQAAASAKQAAIAADQLQIAREGQITDRFTKAIEQLGSKEKLEVRLGGIYSLERIAKESPEDHGPIIEVLATYVRENARLQRSNKQPSKQSITDIRLRADIQAILTVLGRRDATQERYRINLSNTDLAGADLREAHLDGADLNEANLRGAHLERAKLREAHLDRTDLSEADLIGAQLGEAYLERAYISLAKLGGSNLSGAYLGEANLAGAHLGGADLIASNLSRADLTQAYLGSANLSKAQLVEANLSGAYLGRTYLREADLRHADLTKAAALTQGQIDLALGDSKTKLPSGINRPKSWQ